MVVNMPIVIGIPMFLELVDVAAINPEKAGIATALLTVADLFFFVRSYFLYSYLRKMVTKISYNPETDKLTLRCEFGSASLAPEEYEYSPKELEKHEAKSRINKYLYGYKYRSIKKGENFKRFSTERIEGAEWKDEKLFNTIISQPGERFKIYQKTDEEKERSKKILSGMKF